MFRLCKELTVEYHIKFNPLDLQFQLVGYNVKNVKDVSIQLLNIDVVDDVLHLDIYISNDG